MIMMMMPERRKGDYPWIWLKHGYYAIRSRHSKGISLVRKKSMYKRRGDVEHVDVQGEK